MKAIDLFKEAAAQGHKTSINYLTDLGVIEDKFEYTKNMIEESDSDTDDEEEEEESEDENETLVRANNSTKQNTQIFEVQEAASSYEDSGSKIHSRSRK